MQLFRALPAVLEATRMYGRNNYKGIFAMGSFFFEISVTLSICLCHRRGYGCGDEIWFLPGKVGPFSQSISLS